MTERTGDGADPAPLIIEAIRKTAVAWVAVDDEPAYALWCLPLDGSLHVISGPGEQTAPGLADATAATVTLRGDHGGRIVTFRAAVTRLRPDDAQWSTVAPQLAVKRLNAPGSIDDLVHRWAVTGCALNRITPEPADPIAGAALPDGPLTAPLRPLPTR